MSRLTPDLSPELILVRSKVELGDSIHRFNAEAPQHRQRALDLLHRTTYWVYDDEEATFGPAKFIGFAQMNFAIYERAVQGGALGDRFDGNVTKNAIEALFEPWQRFGADFTRRDELLDWGEALLGPSVFEGVDHKKWQFLVLQPRRRFWAFLSNPNRYRISEAIRELKGDSWLIHDSEIKKGDRVAIWKAKGRDEKRGVIALAEVLSDPAVSTPPTFQDRFWFGVAPRNAERRVSIRYVIPKNAPLWLEDEPVTGLPSTPDDFAFPLRRLTVSRATGGTVFKVSVKQWRSLMRAIGGWPEEVPVVSEHEKLPLVVHNRYGRADAYGCFNIAYRSQRQDLNLGLSPKLPDGGYFIFITLDKEEFDPAYDYEDELFSDRFVWITRRGVTGDEQSYIDLRQADRRVSLFVRNNPSDQFLYCGELSYLEHLAFIDPKTGRSQVKMTWRLKQPLPDDLLEELTLGTGSRSKRPGDASPGPKQSAKRTRRPSSFDEFKKAYSYILSASNARTVIPEHYNYQVKLKNFLETRAVHADMEADFIDVCFLLRESYIGEIKVTRHLTVAQAFRAAFGQIIEYRHLLRQDEPNMLIFLDQTLDERRIKIATNYGIVVIALIGDEWNILNPEIATKELVRLFERLS